MSPYAWYFTVYVCVVVVTNAVRYLRPAWAQNANYLEAVAAGIICFLAFRRLYRSGALNLSGSVQATFNRVIEEVIEEEPSDPETSEETARRLQRNARARQRYAERRELERRAQMELNHAQVTARIVRATKKTELPPEPTTPKVEPEPATSKWDRLLKDDDDLV